MACAAAGATGGEEAVDTPCPLTLCELRTDALALAVSFLDVPALARACTPSRQLCEVAAAHEHWRWFVLQFFGVYYDDYMRSVDVHDAFRWRRLFVYIRQVHHNVDRKRGVQRSLPQLLRLCVPVADDRAQAVDSTPSRTSRRKRHCRGSLQVAGNCNVFFWENGRIVQVVRARDGQVLREIDTGQIFRRHFHRLANVRDRLFVCMNDCIKVWEYGINDAHKPPVELPPPRRPPGAAKAGRPLELLVHRRRLILLESTCCLLWDTDSLDFVCCIQHHSEPTAGVELPGGARARERASSPPPSGGRSGEEVRALEVQWMGELIVTWVRNASRSLNVWTLTGQQQAHLRMESPLVQVDVARVTWVSVNTLDHFILCALDSRSVVSLWDSKRDFCPVFRFYCGCEEPFDLVLTQDFMAVINDNVAENRLELCFWKLWLHPNFEAAPELVAEHEAIDAGLTRQATVQPGASPAGASFAPAGGLAAGVAAAAGTVHPAGAAAAHLAGKALQHFLHRELRPHARPIKRLSIPDIDSYFASYRNFLNVCSFHKSGQESLSVYRSSSLQKKIFFPPARHTKFEEWLALQVHNDGTVVLHDFRPNQTAFDEMSPGLLQAGRGLSGGMAAEHRCDRAAEGPEEPRAGKPPPALRPRAMGSRRARRV